MASQMPAAMPHFDHRFHAMGGPCRLRFDCPDEAEAAELIASAEAEAARLERKYSRYLSDSLVARINSAAGAPDPVPIDEETVGLLRFADTLWQQSAGLFDPTAGVLRKAWDFKSGRLPAPAALDALLTLIGWDRVQWDASSIRLPQPGMEIDFGGWVKEYASDSIAAVLERRGVERGLVDLAGDMAVFGAGSVAEPWPVGIRHPRDAGSAIAWIRLAAGGLASSGDYERCMLVGGKRYGHILNPATGWPVQGLVAVSIGAPQCLVAGGSATIAMLLPEAEALEWLAALGLPWFAVDSALACHGDFGSTSGAVAEPRQ